MESHLAPPPSRKKKEKLHTRTHALCVALYSFSFLYNYTTGESFDIDLLRSGERVTSANPQEQHHHTINITHTQ